MTEGKKRDFVQKWIEYEDNDPIPEELAFIKEMQGEIDRLREQLKKQDDEVYRLHEGWTTSIEEADRLRSELAEIQKHSATTVYLGRMDKMKEENEALWDKMERMDKCISEASKIHAMLDEQIAQHLRDIVALRDQAKYEQECYKNPAKWGKDGKYTGTIWTKKV